MVLVWLLGLLVVFPVCAVVLGHVSIALFSHLRRLSYLRHTLRETTADAARSRIRALVHELACMHRLTFWEIRSLFPRRLPESAGRPVVLVHGALGASAPHLSGVRRMLERHGRRTRMVDLRGWFKGPEQKVPRLERALERALTKSPDGVDLVTHSMGGVVLRMLLAERPDLAPHVRRVVCLGAPHRGTAFARGFTCLPEARALHRRSRVLRTLPALSALAPGARITNVAGREDFIVYPPETTRDDDARTVVIDGLGHAGLLVSRRALRATLRGLYA